MNYILVLAIRRPFIWSTTAETLSVEYTQLSVSKRKTRHFIIYSKKKKRVRDLIKLSVQKHATILENPFYVFILKCAFRTNGFENV